MDADRTGTKHGPNTRRVTVTKVAEILGITAEAVRTRIKRDKLRSVKVPPDRTGTVYVLLQADQTSDQTLRRDELVEDLREQVAYLQGVIAVRDRELEQRAEEIRRRDSALEREQQLTAMFATCLGELEAPQEERQKVPRGARADPGSQSPGLPTGSGQQASQTPQGPGFWWRLFGG